MVGVGPLLEEEEELFVAMLKDEWLLLERIEVFVLVLTVEHEWELLCTIVFPWNQLDSLATS